MKKLMSVAAFAAALVVTSVASADNTYVEQNDTSGQNIVFKDDPLAAGGFSANDVMIHVVPSPKRVMLLRARTSFVPELLKTVESL